jgi:hypothetical protein
MDFEIFKEVIAMNDELVKSTKHAEFVFDNSLPEYVKSLVDMTQTVYSYDKGLVLYLTIPTPEVKKVTDFLDLKYGGYDDLINDYKTVSHVGVKYNRIADCL